MDFHYACCASDACDQCNVADEIETQIVVECRVPRIRRRSFQQGVTIGGRPRDNLRGEIATSARPILDHKRLAEAFRQPLADQPRTGVKWPARGKADEQMYWPRWIIVTMKRVPQVGAIIAPQRVKESDHRHRRLLRVRRE